MDGTERRTPIEVAILTIGRAALSIEDVVRVAHGRTNVRLDPDPEYRAWLARGVEQLERAWQSGTAVYGVTTGFGESASTTVPAELIRQLPVNLVRYHGCGTGAPLCDAASAAVVLSRTNVLARGYSGVRATVLERMCELINRRVLPKIPEEGSVGASGDLTPLSYVAAVLMGEREVSHRGQSTTAEVALARERLVPVVLHPKESLAIMNGTSVMTGLACLAHARARELARSSAALTAMASDVLLGNPEHFDARIFALKAHPGQVACARWIREDLGGTSRARGPRLQDRYSIRCAPHVVGVLLDALAFARGLIEIELNSVSDNPIVDPDAGELLLGGNFYGGHVAFAADALKTAVASVADLLDRQLALVCDPSTNQGLPANLVAGQDERSAAHHGFKAMQISASALTAEALKLTMPASVFSRSTECHNQDKVSMGTIAVRDLSRVLDLCETVMVIHLLALCQGVDLRGRERCGPRSCELHTCVRGHVPMNLADRRQDRDIETVLALYRAGELPIGPIDFA